jgi:hypothetical protein
MLKSETEPELTGSTVGLHRIKIVIQSTLTIAVFFIRYFVCFAR